MPGPIRQPVTVNSKGEPLQPLPHGVSCHDVTTHVDDRGSVTELFDLRWGWRAEPLVFSYLFTIRPGVVKGWGLHHHHEDRYMILFGEMEVVLYDARLDSPTHGMVSRIVLSEYRRRLLNIPAGIWHADRNLGEKDTVAVNFPTAPYDHGNPDKVLLPLENDVIPFRFQPPPGR